MMRAGLVLAAAIFILAALPAFAQSGGGKSSGGTVRTSGFFSAAYLQEICKSDARGNETVAGGHTACQAYIAGVIDYHNLMKSLGTAPTIDFCVPNTVPMRRLQNIVWLYLRKNGQHSDFIASPAVTLALFEYYPCRKK